MSRLNTDLVVKFAVRREFRHRAARGIGDDVRDKENGGEHEHVDCETLVGTLSKSRKQLRVHSVLEVSDRGDIADL